MARSTSGDSFRWMLTQPLSGRTWWGSARRAATNSSRTFFGRGMSTRWSPCTWPISRLPRRYSVPPKRCAWVVTPDQPCKALSILFLAPETAMHASRQPLLYSSPSSWMYLNRWPLQTLETQNCQRRCGDAVGLCKEVQAVRVPKVTCYRAVFINRVLNRVVEKSSGAAGVTDFDGFGSRIWRNRRGCDGDENPLLFASPPLGAGLSPKVESC